MHQRSKQQSAAPRLSSRTAGAATALLLGVLFSVMPAEAQNDWVKAAFERGLAGFQGDIGDGLVIASLIGLLIAVLRRSFKTALGFLVVVGGIVILRILIDFLFGS